VRDYLATRKTLKRTCLLLDARHGIKSSDHPMIKLLEQAKAKYQFVLTKCDQVDPEDLARRVVLINHQIEEMNLKNIVKPVWMISAYNFTGIDLLRKELAGLAKYIPKKKSITTKPEDVKETDQSKPTKRISSKESLRNFLIKRNKNVSISTIKGRKEFYNRRVTKRREKRKNAS